MKSFVTIAVTVLAVLMLSSGGLLVTHAATPIAANGNGDQNGSASQGLTMTLQGGVASAGDQTYLIQQNGLALGAVIGGDQIVSTHLAYTLNAVQQGLTTTGSASFQLRGQDVVTGAKVTVSGNLQIFDSIPAVCLPSGSSGVCAVGDTSEVPFAFVAAGPVSMNGATPTIVTMILESAYFDPFGNAITLSSIDGSINILTNYTRATIDWSSVVDMGIFTGAVGSTAISGQFTQFATEHENLVSGIAQDSGMLTLFGVTDTFGNSISYMDASGNYVGSSSIPHAGSSSCGFACTQTGFQDRGSFQLQSDSAMITGTYATSWTVPAFGFQSSVSGQVIQN